MSLKFHKAQKISLFEAGFDERWLQKQIDEDPSILGLGDLTVVSRERKQSSGGRIDFLLKDPETDTMYEVEVMLGQLDESHIIRTIEYWDIERRRWPNREHNAVIVAEEITNRFFNVISLLNRSVPIIAIQFNALLVDDKIVLNFTTVLDIYESPEDEEEEAELTDRQWYERQFSRDSLAVVDQSISFLSVNDRKPRVTYNKHHIAVGGAHKNFCWFHPRKARSHCVISLRIGEPYVESTAEKLTQAGINVVKSRRRKDTIKLTLAPKEVKENEALLSEVLIHASQTTGGGLD